MRLMMVTLALAGAGAGVGVASPALAADNPMQLCGARYQAAKKAGTLPKGQSWMQFLGGCRASLAKADVPAMTPATSAPGKIAAAKATAQPSAAQLAARSRQKQCAQGYAADKAAGKLAGQGWPQYYSACSKRLKG